MFKNVFENFGKVAHLDVKEFHELHADLKIISKIVPKIKGVLVKNQKVKLSQKKSKY